jgi:hypothetical protein
VAVPREASDQKSSPATNKGEMPSGMIVPAQRTQESVDVEDSPGGIRLAASGYPGGRSVVRRGHSPCGACGPDEVGRRDGDGGDLELRGDSIMSESTRRDATSETTSASDPRRAGAGGAGVGADQVGVTGTANPPPGEDERPDRDLTAGAEATGPGADAGVTSGTRATATGANLSESEAFGSNTGTGQSRT